MIQSIGIILFSIYFLAPHAWEQKINSRDGMSYINAAEDLTATGVDSIETQDFITSLYVFAAITDPNLRDSAILGLISIEHDPDFKQRLQSMQHVMKDLLVESVITNIAATSAAHSDSINKLCATLTLLRKGRTISLESSNELRPWGYLLAGGFERFMQSAKQRRSSLSHETIESTLRVELAVLGGPALWSADYAATSGKPVALSVNDDLATMFNIDPTKRLRRNGEWVAR
jgi:hypothetical protein